MSLWQIVFVLFLIGAARQPRRDTPPSNNAAPILSTRTVAFFAAQNRLVSQNRRMDSLDTTLGALTALLAGAAFYAADPAHHNSHLGRVGDFLVYLLFLPALVTGFVWLRSEGQESPAIPSFATAVEQDSERALGLTLEAMELDFEANARVLGWKRFWLRMGVILAVMIGVLTWVAEVVGW